MNTPDKRVEDLVEEMFDTEYFGGKQPNLNKVWLRQALTQYHQDMMSEVVERLENVGHNKNHICRFNDAPQKCDCYYSGIETAKNIIQIIK